MTLTAKLSTLALALAFSAPASATVLNFEYAATSANTFTVVSGDFGKNLNVGDVANLVLKTAANKAFSTDNSDIIWAILGFNQSGTRSANYSYSFLLDGKEVHSGTKSEDTSAIHMGPYLTTGFTGLFDEYRWSAAMSSSTASGNTTLNIMAGGSSGYSYGSTSASLVDAKDVVPTVVPEPASLALLAAGLLGLALRRKRA